MYKDKSLGLYCPGFCGSIFSTGNIILHMTDFGVALFYHADFQMSMILPEFYGRKSGNKIATLDTSGPMAPGGEPPQVMKAFGEPGGGVPLRFGNYTK